MLAATHLVGLRQEARDEPRLWAAGARRPGRPPVHRRRALGNVALARSLAILGLEESGKAIAIHDRRVQMVHEPEGTPFRCDRLDRLWLDHQEKLKTVHSFLVKERYWFSTEPSDPEENEAQLGKIRKWADRHDRLKRRGFYVGLDKTGAVLTPGHVADEESLAEVINHVHQIGWQLRARRAHRGKKAGRAGTGHPTG